MAKKGAVARTRISEAVLGQLARYWFRARLMHDLLHTLMDTHDRDLEKIIDEGYWWEFETYLSYWLSGLFVVVEAFKKLKLTDARVQRLFKENMKHLTGMRHETFHFTLRQTRGVEMVMHQNLNWAEELHEAIGDYIREHVTRKAHVERLLELRAQTKK
jgi:hypothetical protein